CGYLPGEGGAMLILEHMCDAARRGADGCYGEIACYAATFDPAPRTGRPAALRGAIEQALADARVNADEIDAVFADGYGVPALDLREAEALAAVFGPGGVPVTVPKATTGRLYAGGGALDLATALLALRDAVIRPTINVDRLAAGIGIDLVRGQP